MSEPIEPKALHYLYFPDVDGAEQAANEIARNGLDVERRLGADGINWLVLVRHTWPLSPDEFGEIERSLKRITADHAGDYDGWEIPT